METVNLTLDSDLIRFTPDGKIAVVDAIQALSASQNARTIWNHLVDAHPEIQSCYDTYRFQSSRSTAVAGSQGWEKIQTLLFDYLVAMDLTETEEV